MLLGDSMLRKILAISIVFVGFHLKAQILLRPSARAGVNFGTINHSELESRPGFYLGAAMGFRFSKGYTFAPEIGFSTQGAKKEYVEYLRYFDQNGAWIEEMIESKVDARLNYISVGAINKFTFAERYSVLAGPVCDLLVSRHTNSDNDVAAAALLGIQYQTRSGIGVECRVKRSMFDLKREGNWKHEWFGEKMNSNWMVQLGLTYTIDLK